MINLVITAEKTKYVNIELVKQFLNLLHDKILRNTHLRTGFIVFSKQAIPLLDPTPTPPNIASLYDKVPLLRGIPEPALGIYEACDMLLEYDDETITRKIIVLIASFQKKPKIDLEDALEFSESNNVICKLVTTTPRRPNWLSEEKASTISILRSSNIEKLAKNVLS